MSYRPDPYYELRRNALERWQESECILSILRTRNDRAELEPNEEEIVEWYQKLTSSM